MNSTHGKNCTRKPFSFASLVLFSFFFFFKGEEPGSAIQPEVRAFCFSTQHMFWALVSSDAWMIRQTVKTLPVSQCQRGHIAKAEATRAASQRQGRQSLENIKKVVFVEARAEDRLPYFISRRGCIELDLELFWRNGSSGENQATEKYSNRLPSRFKLVFFH